MIFSLFIEDIEDHHWYKRPVEYLISFESNFYDYRANQQISTRPKNDNIVLVEIDDESLQKINSWPIPRDNYSRLINILNKRGARVISFDVLFPEPVKTCGETSPDDELSASIENFMADETKSIVLAYSQQVKIKDFVQEKIPDYFYEPPGEVYMSMVTGDVPSECIASPNFAVGHIEEFNWPIQKFLDAGPHIGYLNMEEDFDGVFRHYTLYQSLFEPAGEEDNILYNTILIPSLSLRTFMSTYDVNTFKVNINKDSCHGVIKLGEKNLELSPKHRTKIRWYPKESFKSYQLHKILEDKNYEIKNADGETEYIDLNKIFKDKVVFIASTATGAHDLRNTAIDPKLPGVYAHMNMVSMLQEQFFYKNIDSSVFHSLAILGIGMVLIILVMLFNKAILDIIVVLLLIIITYAVDYYYYLPEGYDIRLFYCYFAFVATYLWVTILNFNQANAEKKQIKGAFSRYVAPSIVDDMLEHPDKLKVGGEKKDITCMFSDVRDFTSISEKLTPNELSQALNRYMGEMTDIVFETNGTLDKYIGDAIVAFWGAPIDIGDHVNQSVDAAVKMLEALPAINEEFKEKGFPEFKVGLGLNSGECSVGNMGSDQIFAYTALGDNMNLGARLESLCKYYGAQILVSEYTFERMDASRFETRLIDRVIVKGKTEPVGVYEVLYSYHRFMQDKEGLAQFKKAFDLFSDGKFQEALDLFSPLAEKYPEDKASNRMKETCEYWIANPPKEGEDFRVTTMKTKG